MDRETIAFVIIAIFLGIWMMMKKHGPEWRRKLTEQRREERSKDHENE